jgi:phage terminase Nu1 subunit (DNA packaging protein)
MSTNQFDFDFDFGFSTVSADEIPNEKLGTEVEQLQAELAEAKAKTTAVINAVMPLLNNLAKNPENEYILWPNRVAKIDEFKKKLISLQ